MKYLLDTNVISELRKKIPNTKVIGWMEKAHSSQLYLSCITIGEIKMGALKKVKQDQIAGKSLLKWVEDLTIEYAEQIISIDIETCQQWVECLSIDNSTNAIDSLLASQAAQMNMVLVTRNTKHFKMFGVKCLNPFGEDDETSSRNPVFSKESGETKTKDRLQS